MRILVVVLTSVLVGIAGETRESYANSYLSPDYVQRLSHPSLKRRMDARARVLKAGPKAVPALLEVVRGSKKRDPYLYQAALYCLGEIRDPRATQTLLRLARDGGASERQRYWALSSLAKIRAPEAVDLGKEGLDSESGSIQRVSLHLLLSLDTTVSVPILLEGIRSENRSVRAISAMGLRRLTGGNKAFDPDGKVEDREEGIQRWKAWWESVKESPPDPLGMPEMPEYGHEGCRVYTDGGEERAKEIAEKVIRLREGFADWFKISPKGAETRVREFSTWDDFDRYGSMNQWGFVIVSEFFYSSFLHEVVTFDTGDPGLNDRGLIHEVFHDFYHRNTDIQAPWFNEGMAEYFETWSLDRSEFQPGPRNLEWVEESRVVASASPEGFLRKLMLLGQEEFYFQGRREHYALSWAVVDRIITNGAGEGDLRRVFGLLRKGRSRMEVVKRVFTDRELRKVEEVLKERGSR